MWTRIELVAAYSPQARGRKERLYGTLQGRWPQELRIRGIMTVADANAWVRREGIAAYNARFTLRWNFVKCRVTVHEHLEGTLSRGTQFLHTLSSRVEILRCFSAAGFLPRSCSMAEEDILREIADLLAKPKSRSEMMGEFLREGAVLLMVFAPLEALFSPSALRWGEIVALMVLAVSLGYVGLRIEERRE